eukprot:1453159-Amphidinium_carterae.1
MLLDAAMSSTFSHLGRNGKRRPLQNLANDCGNTLALPFKKFCSRSSFCKLTFSSAWGGTAFQAIQVSSQSGLMRL